MRWKENPIKSPCNGDERIVTKFLFLPKKINGETRWLEITSFLQRYKKEFHKEYILRTIVDEWEDVKWL